MIGRKWTAAELAYLEEHAPVERAAVIAEDMTRIFGREFKPEHIRQQVSRRGIPHLSWAGKAAPNPVPLGHEWVDSNGEVWVHVAHAKLADGGYVRKSRLVYEREFGPVPDGCQVIHANRDKSDNRPENLAAVPKAVMGTINRLGLQYHDRESLEAAILHARVRSALFRKRKEIAS